MGIHHFWRQTRHIDKLGLTYPGSTLGSCLRYSLNMRRALAGTLRKGFVSGSSQKGLQRRFVCADSAVDGQWSQRLSSVERRARKVFSRRSF